MRPTTPNSDEGYTLTELLIVLAILSLLVVVIAPRLGSGLSRARSDVAQLRIERIAAALELYSLDCGGYPTNDEGLGALISAPSGNTCWRSPYLEGREAIADPWGQDFHYANPGKAGAYDLFSYGADGREGGGGEDADIQRR